MTVSSLLGFSCLFFPTGKCDFVGLGVNCDYYHAGLGIKERKRVHQLFIRDEIQVIFASFFFFHFFLLIYTAVCTVYSSRVSYKQNIMPKPNSINQVTSYGTEHEKLLFICFNMQWTVAGYHMNDSLCQSLILLIRLGLIALKMKS